jgi:hypothetical protein
MSMLKEATRYMKEDATPVDNAEILANAFKAVDGSGYNDYILQAEEEARAIIIGAFREALVDISESEGEDLFAGLTLDDNEIEQVLQDVVGENISFTSPDVAQIKKSIEQNI